MLIQEVERIEWLQIIVNILAFILELFKPIVTPIGEWMVLWIDFLMNFFPDDNLTIYIIIFITLIVAGVIINCKWPGQKYVLEIDKKKEPEIIKYETQRLGNLNDIHYFIFNFTS